MKPGIAFLVGILFSLALSCLAQAEEIRISAAASMTDAIRHLARQFQSSHPEISITMNFAASGALAKQIAHGAPADIFISANPKWMTYLDDQGALAPGSKHTLTSNTLVFIGQPTNKLSTLTDLPKAKRIAMASPRSAPAGHYAAQAMEAAGVYKILQKAGKVVIAKDVRQAFLYAERGEVDGAFVYGSDARLARKSIVLFNISPELHDPILYPVAVTTAGQHKAGVQALYAFILSPQSQDILRQYGFATP